MRIVIVVVLLLVVSACAEGSEAGPPQDAPYIEGQLTSISPGSPGLILVEEVPDGNKASLRIPDEMPLWRVTADGGTEPAQFSDLAEGQTVAAWVSGPVAESFPVQATADAVLIQHE